ncbi:hypothetical protein BH23GEM10_BH23GEM10_12910 [soil metagenome]
MNTMMKRPARTAVRTVFAFAIAALAAPVAVEAQQPTQQYQQAISANPFGLLLEFFNAEYERVMTEASTAGVGGSFVSIDGDNYVNADVFFRFYPQGIPLSGWAFGAKVGLTRVPDHGTFFGAGFDVNRSWLLGKNDNFYVGTGFGLKRLFGTGDDAGFDVRFVPTIRIVNVGFAF